MLHSDGYIVLNSQPDAKVRLVCFHHAGASALTFAPWGRRMPPQVELYLMELPGRGMNLNKPFVLGFVKAKEYFLTRVKKIIDRPTFFLGHSLGGLLAYSVAASLPKEMKRLVKKVIVSAARSPRSVASHAKHPREPFLIRTRESLYQDLVKLGGVPKDLLEDQEFLEQTINVLGHDFHLLDTYELSEKELGIPLEVWLSKGDPFVVGEDVRWRNECSSLVQIRMFEGDHFYLFKNPEALMTLCSILEKEVNSLNGV